MEPIYSSACNYLAGFTKDKALDSTTKKVAAFIVIFCFGAALAFSNIQAAVTILSTGIVFLCVKRFFFQNKDKTISETPKNNSLSQETVAFHKKQTVSHMFNFVTKPEDVEEALIVLNFYKEDNQVFNGFIYGKNQPLDFPSYFQDTIDSANFESSNFTCTIFYKDNKGRFGKGYCGSSLYGSSFYDAKEAKTGFIALLDALKVPKVLQDEYLKNFTFPNL